MLTENDGRGAMGVGEAAGGRLGGPAVNFRKFRKTDTAATRFNNRLKEVKATPDVEALRTRIEDARKAMTGVEHKPMKGQAPENAAAPTAADLDSMTMFVIQVEATVVEFNKVAARAAAQRTVITEYKNALTATSRAFTTLRDDMEAGRLNATTDFIARAQNLKMATLRLREAR